MESITSTPAIVATVAPASAKCLAVSRKVSSGYTKQSLASANKRLVEENQMLKARLDEAEAKRVGRPRNSISDETADIKHRYGLGVPPGHISRDLNVSQYQLKKVLKV